MILGAVRVGHRLPGQSPSISPVVDDAARLPPFRRPRPQDGADVTAMTPMWTVNPAESAHVRDLPADDPRGLVVVDPHQHRVGEVDGLLMDLDEHRTRLLVVATAGFVGLPRSWRLIPVEAVTRVDDRVHIEASHEQVHRCPPYQPGPASTSTYDEVYDHFGYPPLWRIASG